MKALLFLLLLIGGAAGGYFARPHVDQMIGMGGTEAEVTAKETDEEGRVILTLATEDATMLAAFTERAAEVDRLVAEGARVTLEPGVNAPFLDEPVLVHVRYGEQGIESTEEDENAAEPRPGEPDGAADESSAGDEDDDDGTPEEGSPSEEGADDGADGESESPEGEDEGTLASDRTSERGSRGDGEAEGAAGGAEQAGAERTGDEASERADG